MEKRLRLSHEKQHQVVSGFLVFFALLFCEWFFFRNVLGPGNDSLLGDRGDGRLTNLLTEHWWKFFSGEQGFSELDMFYPHESVIGYTDLFLGYGIIYSFFRMCGQNMLLAYKTTLLTVHIFGTASMYLLLRKRFGCGSIWSLFGTMAFCFSDTLARHSIHTQLIAIAFLPFQLFLVTGFLNNRPVRWKRNIYAYCSLLWFGLLSYNSWYIACFTGLFVLFFTVIYGVRLCLLRVNPFALLFSYVRELKWDFLFYIIFTVILYIPFIQIYLPAIKESSGYHYLDAAYYLPEIADVINVTDRNWLLGRLIQGLGLYKRNYSFEVEEGFSVILLIVFTLSLIATRKKIKEADLSHASDNKTAEILYSLSITVIVSLACIFRLSANGVSLWWVVYHVIPVVRSLRAVARFMLWLSFPMSVLAALCADRFFKKKTPWIGILLLVLLFVSNIDKDGVTSQWTMQDEYRFLDSVPAPPEDAEVLYIIDSAEQYGVDYPWAYQLDAYEIATIYSLKTINGYSGLFPPGWSDIWNVHMENYEPAVWNWVKDYQLENVYAYDVSEHIWSPIEERMEKQGLDISH